jgi:poly-gamma-glutamate synthesis protein (capsule biosynthesis protein)
MSALLPTEDMGAAQVRVLSTTSGSVEGALAATWVYVPVVPFPSLAENVQTRDLLSYWQGNVGALGYLTATGVPPTLVVTPPTLAWLTELLGPPTATAPIQVVPTEGLVTALWAGRPSSWSIVPFDQLDPALKALTLDGRSLFDRALIIDQYPLVQRLSVTGTPEALAAVTQHLQATGRWQALNRDPAQMTILVMTGVTALVRATAFAMENNGVDFPARDILPFFADADLVHTSNEVSFAANCPYPNPSYQVTGLIFCSRDKYFDLLRLMRLNVVELTGNHVMDYGAAAMLRTLDMYDAAQIGTFGGGRNADQARQALIRDHNGNSVAFIGCNPAGPRGAWAGVDSPGAAFCDDDFLRAEIARLKLMGKVVIMTLQYNEYYSYAPPQDQIAFFAKYADFGADLVMGSQAHQPQGFGFTQHTFIHYGLGNLYFDQMDALGTRQMFADKLILYQGRHLSTVLFTGLIEDYARPRPMNAEERAGFLLTIFRASGW